jgi:hypothetical protein
MPLQVQKGKFVMMAACAASGALAFSLAGEQLWLGRVEHRGQDSLKLHYYQQPCTQLGKSLNLSSFSSMLDVLSVVIIVRWSYQKRQSGSAFDKRLPRSTPLLDSQEPSTNQSVGTVLSIISPLVGDRESSP